MRITLLALLLACGDKDGSDTGTTTGDGGTTDGGNTTDGGATTADGGTETGDGGTETGDGGTTDGGTETGDGGTETGDGGTAETAMPDFSLADGNPASPRYGQVISPRDYLEQVSGWYFIHAT